MRNAFPEDTKKADKSTPQNKARYFSVENVYYAYAASYIDTETHLHNKECMADTIMHHEDEENKLAVIELIEYLIGFDVEVNQDIIALCKSHIEQQYPEIINIAELYDKELIAANGDARKEQMIIGNFINKHHNTIIPLNPISEEEKLLIYSYQATKDAPGIMILN